MASSSGKRSKWERDQQAGQKDRKRKNVRNQEEDKFSDKFYDKWLQPLKTTEGTPGGKYKEDTTAEAILKYKEEKAGVWTDKGSDSTSHNDGSWQIQKDKKCTMPDDDSARSGSESKPSSLDSSNKGVTTLTTDSGRSSRHRPKWKRNTKWKAMMAKKNLEHQRQNGYGPGAATEVGQLDATDLEKHKQREDAYYATRLQ
jgi:hypothetical protein